MSSTVAATTPYAWPYDGAFAPDRAALLVVTSAGAPAPLSLVGVLAGAFRRAGGAVVDVTTASSGRGAAAPARTPPPFATDRGVVATGVDGFYGSPLDHLLRSHGRDQLLLVGGWLETSVHSTMRSANDRGYECLLLLDACTAYDPALVAASRSQIEMSGGIFGAVGHSADVLAAIPAPERNAP